MQDTEEDLVRKGVDQADAAIARPLAAPPIEPPGAATLTLTGQRRFLGGGTTRSTP